MATGTHAHAYQLLPIRFSRGTGTSRRSQLLYTPPGPQRERAQIWVHKHPREKEHHTYPDRGSHAGGGGRRHGQGPAADGGGAGRAEGRANGGAHKGGHLRHDCKGSGGGRAGRGRRDEREWEGGGCGGRGGKGERDGGGWDTGDSDRGRRRVAGLGRRAAVEGSVRALSCAESRGGPRKCAPAFDNTRRRPVKCGGAISAPTPPAPAAACGRRRRRGWDAGRARGGLGGWVAGGRGGGGWVGGVERKTDAGCRTATAQK